MCLRLLTPVPTLRFFREVFWIELLLHFFTKFLSQNYQWAVCLFIWWSVPIRTLNGHQWLSRSWCGLLSLASVFISPAKGHTCFVFAPSLRWLLCTLCFRCMFSKYLLNGSMSSWILTEDIDVITPVRSDFTTAVRSHLSWCVNCSNS